MKMLSRNVDVHTRGAASMLLCGILVAGVSGCATRGGGETWPISVNGQKVLVNSASVLSMETSQSCNAQAQVEYNLNIAVCEGKLTAVFPIQLAGVNAQAQLLCQAFGYTNSSGQLAVPESIELGNCRATAMPVTPHVS